LLVTNVSSIGYNNITIIINSFVIKIIISNMLINLIKHNLKNGEIFITLGDATTTDSTRLGLSIV